MAKRLLMALAILSGGSAVAAERTYRIGHIPLSASLPVYAAMAGGCFDTSGLRVELVPFGSSNEVAQAGLRRDIDVIAASAINAVLDQIEAMGAGARAFLFTQYSKRPSLQSTDFLVAQPDIRSVAALRGRRVAFFPGSVSRVLAKLTLPKYGLSLQDITLVEMAPGRWAEALARREVDAAHVLEPAATMILKQQTYNVLIDGYWGEVQEKVPVAAAWFVDGSLQTDEEQAFYGAFACGLEVIAGQPALARRALTTYAHVPEAIAPDIRLLDYAMAHDREAATSAAAFVELLQSNDATTYRGRERAWLYRN